MSLVMTLTQGGRAQVQAPSSRHDDLAIAVARLVYTVSGFGKGWGAVSGSGSGIA
jgi:hypothetical protein